jgi:Flp pilus assembly protein TadD
LGVMASGLVGLLLAGCQTTGADQVANGGVASVNANAPVGSEGVPNDRALGKTAFRNQSFGLAEMHFRRAVESNATDAESWLGLAASYDNLRRFDLADRAYGRAIGLAGQTPEILNNRGYSYMLRGDMAKARRDLNAARAKDPQNPLIANNLKLLDEQGRLGR